MRPHATIQTRQPSRDALRTAGWLGAIAVTAATVFASGMTTGAALHGHHSHADPRFSPVAHDPAATAALQASTPRSEPDIEAGRQIAFATLFAQHHEVSQTQVTFYRDTRQPGNAIQQFGTVFGGAIAHGSNPAVRSSPLEPATRQR